MKNYEKSHNDLYHGSGLAHAVGIFVCAVGVVLALILILMVGYTLQFLFT